MDAWQIIGFFGSAAKEPLPQVLTAAVLDPAGQKVAISDVGTSAAELEATEAMSLDEFHECTGLGSAMPLPPVLWEPFAVLFLMDGSLDLVSCWEAEVRMKQFVENARSEAELALSEGNLERARELYWRAMCVSQEEDDIQRCAELEPDPAIRTYVLAALA